MKLVDEKRELLPISVILPTAGRAGRLLKTLNSLKEQNVSVSEVIIVAANTPAKVATQAVSIFAETGTRIFFEEAFVPGAAAQRNQAFAGISHPFVMFMDDDIDLQAGCLDALWNAIQSDQSIGGTGVHIINQPYHSPKRLMRLIYASVGCPLHGSLAGRCCGPALNFLPSPENEVTEKQTVDWLNSTCTLYRRSALPPGLFPDFFVGYSLMEDVALSLEVGRKWRLATANRAFINHDTQPRDYKSKIFERQRMEFVNRYFVMTRCMDKRSLSDTLLFMAYQLFGVLLKLRRPSEWRFLPLRLAALAAGCWTTFTKNRVWRSFQAR